MFLRCQQCGASRTVAAIKVGHMFSFCGVLGRPFGRACLQQLAYDRAFE